MSPRLPAILLFSFLCILPAGNAQHLDSLPRLQASYRNHFYEEDLSYSSQCFEDAFQDQQGRLWLNGCGAMRMVNSLSLLQFDGYVFRPADLIDPAGNKLEGPVIHGVDRHGRLFGAANDRRALFFCDPETRAIEVIPPPDSFTQKIHIRSIKEVAGGFSVLRSTGKTTLSLFSLQDDRFEEIVTIQQPRQRRIIGPYPHLVSEEAVWFMDEGLPLYRWDRHRRTLRRYEEEDFLDFTYRLEDVIRGDQIQGLSAALSATGALYLILPDPRENQLFQLDRQEDVFRSINRQFPSGWVPQKIFSDQKGNLCFLFQDAAGNYQAILQDERERRYHYSSVVENLPEITKITGKDFRQKAFITTGNGLYSVGIRNHQAIRRALPGKWIGGMAELPDGRFLVSAIEEGWFLMDASLQKAIPFTGPDCGSNGVKPFGKGMTQQIIPDSTGNYWFIHDDHLIRYHPATEACTSFPLGRSAALFALISEHLVAVLSSDWELFFYNPGTRSEQPFDLGMPRRFSSLVRDLYVDEDGVLWIPTNSGLWKVDLEKERSEHFGPRQAFSDTRFVGFYRAPDKKLWLGTYYGGIHLFDPETEAVSTIDRRHGLSDNAVLSILADHDGDIWATTEYGINLLAPEGQVRAEFHVEDGLASERFERFDPLLSSDGRLLFGSPAGLNIIDPAALKAAIVENQDNRIFFTEVVHYDGTAGSEAVHHEGLHAMSTLHLPASQPYLKLKFALSNYIEPRRNRYAYKLEGLEEDWTYLGNRHELDFNRMPPGEYRLLVKGADYRNHWTSEPVALSIHAHEFFYKEYWFYGLIIGFISLLAFVWIRRLRSEKIRLEEEVLRRTERIRSDKALIERQAEELRALDDLKSRFFTNISHELRTPITLITAPVEQLLRRPAPTMGEGLERSLRTVLNNGRKLLHLVEELLDLSRLEANKLTLHETPTPPAAFCRQLFDAFAPRAALQQVRFHYRTDLSGEDEFWIDRRRLEKIVNNLLSNALKFTAEKGSVIMAVEKEIAEGGSASNGSRPASSFLRISVTDTGRGIPPEDLPHVFERYFQTKRKELAGEGGLGVGLALSKELARLMGGDLQVTSQWGAGSTFTLLLPARMAGPSSSALREPNPSPSGFAEKAATRSPGELPAIGDRRPQILIVEDNPDMQQLLQGLLSEWCDCHLADDGAEAWERMGDGKWTPATIDLILSDIMMPRLDGYQLLKNIKEHPDWQKLPVVMLTARAEEEDKLQALRLGVDDYLLKPFSPAELSARIANLLVNYQRRKAFVREQPAAIDLEFEEEEAADQRWLRELETAAKAALQQQLDLNAAYLADQMALSERQLRRRLQALTGLNCKQYIQEVKLQKARHLLEHRSTETVAEVAYACGFNTPAYFSRIFEKRYGRRPADYLDATG